MKREWTFRELFDVNLSKQIWQENRRSILRFLEFSVILIFLTTFFGITIVPTESMENTIAVNDMVLYQVNNTGLHRGDMVVFRSPIQSKEMLVKRIIGLPGETLVIKNGNVFINGILLQESYLKETPTGNLGEQVIPADRYFVMGDNRKDSYDSRYWGTVPKENIKGVLMARILPFNRIKWLK